MVMQALTGLACRRSEVEFTQVSRALPRKHGEPAGHSKMDEQDLARIEPRQNVFCPPPQSGDPAAGQPIGKAVGKRKAETGAPQAHGGDTAALKNGLQAPHDGFDFRKLWHDPV